MMANDDAAVVQVRLPHAVVVQLVLVTIWIVVTLST